MLPPLLSVDVGCHLFLPIEHVESVFVGPWNVSDVTYCNLVTVGVGLRLSVQCKFACTLNLNR